MMGTRRIVAVTAPSGAGKTTLVRRILGAFPALHYAVSVTTRPPRPGEVHGQDYFFVSQQRFRNLMAADALFEYEEVYPGRFYGTPRSELEGSGPPVLVDVDVVGACRLRRLDDRLVIFVAPPSLEVLRERLVARGTESGASLQARLARASEELRYIDRFDAVIVNDDLEQAARTAVNLVSDFLES
ncbi:MAG: guanylate kinase [Bacteroidota bacterium]|nr:guanylate kinase [Bacteroidota bacterium]